MSETEKNCGCEIKNPLQRDGTSQAERLLNALDPTYVQVDERQIDDLLRFALKHAEKLNYYSNDNIISGDWYNFLAKDVSVLCADISGVDIDQYVKEFRATFKKLEALTKKTIPPADAEVQTTYLALYPPLIALVNLLSKWFNRCDERLPLRKDLELYFTSIFDEGFLRFREIDAAAASYNPGNGTLIATAQGLVGLDVNGDWNSILSAPVVANTAIFSPTVNDKSRRALAAAYYIRGIFDEFYMALLTIISKAPTYLTQSLEEYPWHKAQASLFLTFLQLFSYAQQHLNSLTQRHLDFYFDRVLQLQRRPAVADSVHLILELAANVAEYDLPEGTLMKAGKDALGKPMVYGTDDQLVFNKAQAVEFRSIYIQREIETEDENAYEENAYIYASPVANSTDGLGAALNSELPQWEAFGGPQYNRTPELTMPDAKLGFALSSPQLLLAEGERTITLTITNKKAITGLTSADLKEAFTIEITTAKGWFKFSPSDTNTPVKIENKEGDKQLVFTLVLENDKPATTAWNSAIHLGTYNTTWPLLRITLNNVAKKGNAWAELQQTEPVNVNIAVAVKNLQSIIIQNDQAKGDPAKPFQPFGVLAPKGAAFYIGSEEIFYKTIRELSVTVDWHETPDTEFKAHYQNYFALLKADNSVDVEVLGGANPFATEGNLAPKASISYLSGRAWAKPNTLPVNTPPAGEAKVINSTNAVSVTLFQSTATNLHTFKLVAPANGFLFDAELPDTDQYAELKEYGTNTQRGFLRFQLGDIDFQHSKYTAALMKSAQLASGTTPKQVRINAPYTPVFKSISVSYSSARNLNAIHDAFYLVHPFGEELISFSPSSKRTTTQSAPQAQEQAARLIPDSSVDEGTSDTGSRGKHYLVPDYTLLQDVKDSPLQVERRLEGMLFIALSGLKPPQSIAMLVQTVDDSGDPNQNKPEVIWSYLRDNKWIELDQSQLVSDTTNGFLNSGIIELGIPEEATTTNTILPGANHWIRATTILKEDPPIDGDTLATSGSTNALSNVLSIQTQAIKASFRDNNNDPEHLRQALEAQTISKLQDSISAIKSVKQPYGSFGGKLSEAGDEYYLRVSERLRHKGRAITIWDYERLVLESFPSIYKVKCINHMRHRSINNKGCYNQMAGGSVTVIVVSNLRNQNLVNPLQPTTSNAMREEIKTLLKKRNSRFAEVSVINPLYEEVVVQFKVFFGKEFSSDKGYYSKLLNEDIKKFLSPWAFEEGSDIRFGGKLHASYILNYIEEREYVDYVTDFQLFRAENGVIPAGSPPLEEISASEVYSILVSAPKHNISY